MYVDRKNCKTDRICKKATLYTQFAVDEKNTFASLSVECSTHEFFLFFYLK